MTITNGWKMAKLLTLIVLMFGLLIQPFGVNLSQVAYSEGGSGNNGHPRDYTIIDKPTLPGMDECGDWTVLPDDPVVQEQQSDCFREVILQSCNLDLFDQNVDYFNELMPCIYHESDMCLHNSDLRQDFCYQRDSVDLMELVDDLHKNQRHSTNIKDFDGSISPSPSNTNVNQESTGTVKQVTVNPNHSRSYEVKLQYYDEHGDFDSFKALYNGTGDSTFELKLDKPGIYRLAIYNTD